MKRENLIWIIIFLIGFAVRSTELLHPIDTTEWRESDVSSIARNYYRNGMEFTHPQIDWGGTGPGYTESEFPVYPYLIALSYKLFGFWEPFGRIISFLFSLGALLIFFRLSRFLFTRQIAIASSCFFTLSPLLAVTSNTIQPESMMFFFYIGAADSFMHWIDNQSYKFYISTFIFTALALLCKLTAVNIGVLFVLTIIIYKGLKYLLQPKVILLGILSISPSIIWYTYSHRFYLLYGNSLGLSNEYPWAGWDFLTNFYFIKGIIRQELIHVWTYAGSLIFIIALFATNIIKRQYFIFPVCWLAAAAIFYIIAARTTADDWASYYHIFSIPSASMLLGISVSELYKKYFPVKTSKHNPLSYIHYFFTNNIIAPVLAVLILFELTYTVRYLTVTNKPSVIKTSLYYECKNRLSGSIPQGSIILASGAKSKDGKYPTAYNASYFFYWLDRKGFNICVEDQSIECVMAFKDKGAEYYIAEIQAMRQRQGFEDVMRNKFKIEMECNGIILFKL